ncbi:hypothetical protein COB72_01920 [bacterium]|nr:MAG: hypothetical protein COB72_01920 [bacterium]
MAIVNTTFTTRHPLGQIDLSQLGERVMIDLRTIGTSDPIKARIECLRQSGWATQPIKVRRRVHGIEMDFETAKAIAVPGTPVGIVTLVEQDLDGSPQLSIGADAIEANSTVSVMLILTWAQ